MLSYLSYLRWVSSNPKGGNNPCAAPHARHTHAAQGVEQTTGVRDGQLCGCHDAHQLPAWPPADRSDGREGRDAANAAGPRTPRRSQSAAPRLHDADIARALRRPVGRQRCGACQRLIVLRPTQRRLRSRVLPGRPPRRHEQQRDVPLSDLHPLLKRHRSRVWRRNHLSAVRRTLLSKTAQSIRPAVALPIRLWPASANLPLVGRAGAVAGHIGRVFDL